MVEGDIVCGGVKEKKGSGMKGSDGISIRAGWDSVNKQHATQDEHNEI